MSTYRIKEAVCDWGIYDGDEILLIVNYKKNAEKILEILQQDIRELHGETAE